MSLEVSTMASRIWWVWAEGASSRAGAQPTTSGANVQRTKQPGARAQKRKPYNPPSKPTRLPCAAAPAAHPPHPRRSLKPHRPPAPTPPPTRSGKMNKERLMKMAGAVRTGGKGTVRRKNKAVHKTATTDDKRLQSTLKRVGVNTIPAIEEVNIFKDDLVIQFLNPKVQASIAATHGWSVGLPDQEATRCSSFYHQPIGP
ncbi:hypothetical protein ZWY2020_010368 [Hordeum vulgare]|nr:hypothetical protein ZWY2020_010368 [Hordeum vulgare]